jgi:hypothetical protein
VARKSLLADDLNGLIDWLKANPGKATEGHVGIGSVGHIGGLLLQNMTGTRFQQVPYRGSAPVMILVTFGAPGDIPPCIRQRPFGIAADRQPLPLLVRAPHRRLRCIANLPCMGLILLNFDLILPPALDVAHDRLGAFVDVDVLDRGIRHGASSGDCPPWCKGFTGDLRLF